MYPSEDKLPVIHAQLVSNITTDIYVYSTGSDVTDHVPVDDNPAYMTMKSIHMNKNSAYETVNM